jgi:hypothetical protein
MGTQHRIRSCIGALVATIWALAVPAFSGAEGPGLFMQLPEMQKSPGQGAAKLDHPRGVAADPDNGHLFVADLNNSRISEYTAWGLFVKSWGWGVADGSVGPQSCGPSEPQADPEPSLCRKGINGQGPGQFNLPVGIAVDEGGDIYVFEFGNLRVQKFSPEGEFLLMFGGDVNKTKVDASAPAAQRNVCPIDEGDVCQAGTSGEAPSQLSGATSDNIDYTPAEGGRILVGDKGGIQVFDLIGNHVKTIPFSGALAAFAGQSVNALDVDKAANIYFSLSGLEDVFKTDSAGAPLDPGKPGESKFEVDSPVGVAVDLQGSVYAIDSTGFEGDIWKYDAAGNQRLPTVAEEESGSLFPYVPFQGPALTGLATNLCEGSQEPGNLYVSFFTGIFLPISSYVNGYGTPPVGCEPPPPRPPEITEQFVRLGGREEATVKAQINPKFWPDATYYVEYGTGKCSTGGCGSKQPISPRLLTSGQVGQPVPTASILLDDLAPATTYHFRFVAQSSGGGPVFGVDPDGTGSTGGPMQPDSVEGLEGTFRTFAADDGPEGCPNGAVRNGLAERLPDCRAYEMVSPLDKGGGDVALSQSRNSVPSQKFEVRISAPSADRFTYTSVFAFGGAESTPFASQYIGERGPTGWSSTAISPPRSRSPVSADTMFGAEFQGFSEDLCQAWLRHYSVAPLVGGAIPGYANLYRRSNCADPPIYEALTTEKPHAREPSKYFGLRLHGFSESGDRAIFGANDKLHPDAPTLAIDTATVPALQLYEAGPEGLRFVCYLPDGTPVDQTCAAGTVADGGGGSRSSVHNAISADGSRIFWSSYTGSPGIGEQSGAPGRIYVRIDGNETREVSTAVADDRAWYLTAADDGSKAVFVFEDGSSEDELYEFDVDTGTSTMIAGEVEGFLGASEDASRIYFASKEDLDGGGAGAVGARNLYLYEASAGGPGTYTFIMNLAQGDFEGRGGRSPAHYLPALRAARVSPDGLHAAFVSAASPTPTGYDNRDADSGVPALEVYLYDAVDNELRCVSCNPTGARPIALRFGNATQPLASAAGLEGWEALLHAPRVLTDDGTRVFFESFEALTPRDTNATWDVYQWEEVGKGTCKATSASFVEDSGGCVALISSGDSARPSTFLDADPSGESIFFGTLSSLVGVDYGLNDVYVARVGGGFPEPQKAAGCEGEACQSPPPAPADVTPSSEVSRGDAQAPGSRPRPRRCAKGKRKVRRAGKVRCVKKASRGRNGARR